MAFDIDFDVERRAHSPSFYGYTPNNSRGRIVVAVSMFLFIASHVMVRMIGVTVLAIIGPLSVLAVVGGDLLCFFCYKILRNDLRYWLKLDGAFSWFVSCIVRLISKVMLDSTAFVQLRHPLEIGA